MTQIAFHDGKPVMRDGKVGTGQGCCCVKANDNQGACCAFNSCEQLSEADCAAKAQSVGYIVTFLGVGTECDDACPVGACCFEFYPGDAIEDEQPPIGEGEMYCFMLNLLVCNQLNGFFQGVGTTCPGDCPPLNPLP